MRARAAIAIIVLSAAPAAAQGFGSFGGYGPYGGHGPYGANRGYGAPAGGFDARAPVAGRASVIDGDTIEVQGRRVRLFGIDAPESSQSCEDASGSAYRCGQRAAMALDGLIGASPVSCEPRDVDRYGRLVAVCSARGIDLNGWMVLNGQAVAYTRYGRDYEGAEREARQARRGIWGGRFQEPSEYRAENRR